MEFRFFFIEESTQCLFSTEATQRHHRGHRGQRGENAMPFSREVTEAPLFFLLRQPHPHPAFLINGAIQSPPPPHPRPHKPQPPPYPPHYLPLISPHPQPLPSSTV